MNPAAKKSVLLVDDEPLVRECFEHVLGEVGFSVTTAADAIEAIRILHRLVPDLILLDVNLGRGPDGLACCRTIRERKEFQSTPIVMLTGDAHRETVVGAARAGANGYILKTMLSIPDFVERLEKFLQGTGKKRPSGATGAVGSGAHKAEPPPAAGDSSANPPPARTLTEQEVIRRLPSAAELPAMPFVAIELAKRTVSSGSTTQDVISVIQRDPAVTARVLRVANSSYYRSKDSVSSLERAGIGLGFAGLRNLSANLPTYGGLYVSPQAYQEVLGLWLHSLACGVLVQSLMAGTPPEEQDQAFVVGLLHDYGRMIAQGALPDAYAEVMQDVIHGAPLCQAEQTHLHLNHGQIAQRIFLDWKFPAALVQPITLHHEPWGRLRGQRVESLRATAALWVAERVLATQRLGAPDDDFLEPIPEEAAQVLGLEPGKMRTLVTDLYDRLDELVALLYLHLPDGLDPPPLVLELPPAKPTRKALWVRRVEPRVDVLGLLLNRLDFSVETVPDLGTAAERGPDLLLVSAGAAGEVGSLLKEVRELNRQLAGTPRRCLVVAPTPAIEDPSILPEDPALLAHPWRVRRIEDLLRTDRLV